jgi:hypothetical protein
VRLRGGIAGYLLFHNANENLRTMRLRRTPQATEAKAEVSQAWSEDDKRQENFFFHTQGNSSSK